MRLPIVLAVAVLAAGPVDAQMVTIPFGGPKKERPSPNIWLRGSPAGVAAAVAMRSRPTAMTDLDESRHPIEVLQYFGLSIGSRVLDVAAESGYYSEIIGVAVGSGGKVTALVPPVAMKDPIERKAMIEVVGRVPNVSILAASPAAVQLPANSFDFVLMHLAYHDLYRAAAPASGPADLAGFLRRIYAALRPGGIVGVVDHVAAPGGDTSLIADKLQRIDPATVKADFVRAGFVLDGESDLLRRTDDDHSAASDAAVESEIDRFVLRFRKPE